MIRWIWDWAKYHNSHSSKSIKVTKLSFGQNDFPRSTRFWQKNSLVTLLLFELWLFWYWAQSQIHRITLYVHIRNFWYLKKNKLYSIRFFNFQHMLDRNLRIVITASKKSYKIFWRVFFRNRWNERPHRWRHV